MTDTPLADFLPQVIPYMPSVPDPVALDAIRSALIDFCNASHWWLVEHDPVTTLKAVATYDLDPPVDAQVIRVHHAWHDGQALFPSSEDELHRLLGPTWYERTGTPRYISQMSSYEVMLTPTPEVATTNGLRMLVALAPSRGSDAVDEGLFNRWAEKIGYGARARLHETPNTTYYDPKAAVYYRRLFAAAIGEAKVERNRGLTRFQPHLRPPRGAC